MFVAVRFVVWFSRQTYFSYVR